MGGEAEAKVVSSRVKSIAGRCKVRLGIVLGEGF